MAATWEVPGEAAIIENEDGATWETPGGAAVTEKEAAVGGLSIPVAMVGYRQRWR